MPDIHIGNLSGSAQYEPDHIGIGILIADHILHHKTLYRKVAGNIQLRRFSKHHARHALVQRAAEIPECRMLFMVISCIYRIISFFQTANQLVHFICRRLPIVIQAYHIIPVRIAQSGHQRGMLPEVSGEINPFDLIVFPA